jgi:endonuclease/exonuclease/phosphatase family metal-dependent hydrolase
MCTFVCTFVCAHVWYVHVNIRVWVMCGFVFWSIDSLGVLLCVLLCLTESTPSNTSKYTSALVSTTQTHKHKQNTHKHTHPHACTLYRLSRDFGDEFDAHQRVVQRTLVETAFGPVNLFQTHLSLSPKARLRNVREIWAYVQRFSTPQVLLGDLNATPKDQAVRFLCGKFEQQGESGDFVDAWSLRPRNVTTEQRLPDKVTRNGFTFSSFEPNKRIDYILLRGWALEKVAKRETNKEEGEKNGEMSKKVCVERFQILGRKPIGPEPMYTSDHFPIQITIADEG